MNEYVIYSYVTTLVISLFLILKYLYDYLYYKKQLKILLEEKDANNKK